MAVLPIAEILARGLLHFGIPGSGPFVQHLTLWVAFLGAALAAREGRLLALATTTFIPEGRWRRAAEIFSSAVGACVAALLGRAAAELVVVEKGAGTLIAAGVRVWMALLVLPLAFGLIAVRLVWRASPRPLGRLLAGAGLAVGLWIGQFPGLLQGKPLWPGLAILGLATALGGPLFALLGGAAVWLFLGAGEPIAAVPVETYRLTVSATLPAIPLFTLAGFFLSEGQSSRRLLRVFRALFGWIPGGTAVVCAVVCAFFTAFTGGSGVTILALGALLFQALREDSYRERFSLGLLTATGSLGLLFAPSLPLILYGIVAQIRIEDLFLGGMLPGLLLLSLTAVWGVREGMLTGAGRSRFEWREVGGALNEAKWELLLPAVVLVAIFGGFATVVEASALTVLYAFFMQCFVHRDLSVGRDVPRVLLHSVVLVGGVMVILGAAMGLTSYMVDAEVPAKVLEWTEGHVHSPLVFLLYLNLFLLVVGCLMDIFSAIVVVVPLIVPVGMAFGINPVHLGIIFIANLELGYLTPPVGLNLYLASFRFGRPMLEVTRAAVPMLLILGFGVLVITYVPWLTTGVLKALGRG
ncbi:MAG: TRAP transporter large permease subunit [Candidatus Eisenbacteria bacterium]|uniref:TRAP transporter large permease subunit n=1 Tax=Eiseniibacteriota bacterium TaxID=2212470 RepID=A0A538SL46_UNCEI|nr:MAG: TRAP transporter large permease subunit [Candidatus Eisenbacteria bacterium]